MGSGARVKALAAFLALIMAMPAHAQIVIAHRGASGERPEHTLASYERAIDQDADYVEPDLVVTSDGVLVARHENEMSDTTDVADRPEFADRRATKTIGGKQVTGWFAEDFTLAELRTLRARERLPHLRPANARFDGLWQVPTLAEIIALVKAKEAETGRPIGIYPELKHPAFLSSQGHDTARLLVEALDAAGYSERDNPVFLQCFEPAALMALAQTTSLRRVQLIGNNPEGGTYPPLPAGGPEGIASYADAIGAEISLLLDEDGRATAFLEAALGAGLEVHAWTLRRENFFLPARYREGDDPAGEGRYADLWAALAEAGVRGVFTDNPVLAVAARDGGGE
jgi:glycerophosphoryl diester phosphodiesterase